MHTKRQRSSLPKNAQSRSPFRNACIGVANGEPQCARGVRRQSLSYCLLAVLPLVLVYDQTIYS